MTTTAPARWGPPLVTAIGGVVATSVVWSGNGPVAGTIFGTLFGGLMWWAWPGRTGAHQTHAEARAEADDDDLIVYWRPG